MNTSLSFRVLGPLEVHTPAREVPVPAGKLRVVLATLLLHAGSSVSVDELIERLWTAPPGDARGTAQVYVGRLRRMLRAATGGRDVIDTSPHGYLVAVDDASLDLRRFEHLTERAQQVAGRTDPVEEARLLRAALDLWRGRALANVESESLQGNEVLRITEQRLRAAERCYEIELRIGDPATIVPELRRLLRDEPYRENLWALLMTALYQGGRQAEALECYRMVSVLLRDELGIDPGSRLRGVHQAILEQSLEPSAWPALALPSTSARQSAPARPSGGTSAPYHAVCQLPPDIADFIGREAAIEAITAHLEASHHDGAPPVVVITGPPGVGKTTLAVHIAHRLRRRYPDGQLYLPLAGTAAPPRDSARALSDLLAATGALAPVDPHNRQAAWRARTADRRLLLILDDAAGPEHIQPLLPGTPGCAVLVTSRQLLAELPGAVTVHVAPFDTGEATALLGAILGAARVATEPGAAREIGLVCGGIPLALRIAGARLAARPGALLTRFVARLRDRRNRLDELRTAHLEVRPGLELSYGMLDPLVRTAFRRLGLLEEGDFAAWTLGALLGRPDVERPIEELCAANLVQPAGIDATGEPRYRMHDLPATYASELAARDDPGERFAARNRYFETLFAQASLAHAAQPRRFGELPIPDPIPTLALPEEVVRRVQDDPVAWLASERAHLDVAIAEGCALGRPGDTADLISTVTPLLLYQHGNIDRLIQQCGRVSDAAMEAGEVNAAWRVRYIAAMIHAYFTEILHPSSYPGQSGVADLTTCADAFERLEMDIELLHALAFRAILAARRGPSRALHHHARRALAIAEQAGVPRPLMLALTATAEAEAAQGDHRGAVSTLERALDNARIHHEPHYQAVILSRLGQHLAALGELDRAINADKSAIHLFTNHDDRYAAAMVRVRLAAAYARLGEHAMAIDQLERGRRIMADFGHREAETLLTKALGETHLATGNDSAAINQLERALHLAESSDSPQVAQGVRDTLAHVHVSRGTTTLPNPVQDVPGD